MWLRTLSPKHCHPERSEGSAVVLSTPKPAVTSGLATTLPRSKSCTRSALQRVVILSRRRRICSCLSWVHAIERPTIIGRLTVVPIPAEIGPRRICRFDECDFSGSSPSLQFLLPSDGSLHILMALKPDQRVAAAEGDGYAVAGVVFAEHEEERGLLCGGQRVKPRLEE